MTHAEIIKMVISADGDYTEVARAMGRTELKPSTVLRALEIAHKNGMKQAGLLLVDRASDVMNSAQAFINLELDGIK